MFSGTRGKNIDAHYAHMHVRLRRHFKDICERMREAARRRLEWVVPSVVPTDRPKSISAGICEGIATIDTSAAISASFARCNWKKYLYIWNIICFYHRDLIYIDENKNSGLIMLIISQNFYSWYNIVACTRVRSRICVRTALTEAHVVTIYAATYGECIKRRISIAIPSVHVVC